MLQESPRRPARLSIRQKFLLAIGATALAMAVIGYLAYAFTSRELREDARQQLASVANLEEARLEQQLATISDKLGQVVDPAGVGAEFRAFAAEPTARNRAALRRALQAAPRLPGLESLSAYSITGRRITTGILPNGSRAPRAPAGAARQLVLRSIQTKQPWSAGLAYPTPEGGSYLHAVQVRQGGRVVGVLVAECDLAEISALLSGASDLGATADVHLVQRDPASGGAQFLTDLAFRPDSRFDLIIPPARASSPAIQAIRERPPDTVQGVRDYRGEPVIAALRPVDRTEWVLVVKVDESEAFAVARRIGLATFIAFAAAIGILGIVLLLVSRSVTGRIRRVTEKATAISRGDLDARVGDPSHDELGILAAAFDRMADTLSADIGRRRRIEAQLEHQAAHDILTGLPNRTRFQERLDNALAIAGPTRVAVLFCDLDEFKSVNDELGHAAGDQLLTVVAHRFRAALRPADMLARFGGDEFVVVCTGIADEHEAEVVAARLQAALADPIALGASEAFVSVSIGIALDEPGATPESMVRDADAAMYRAKELGRRRHVTHNEEIRERAGARLTAATDLRRAIDQGRLALVYQPIVDLRRLEVVAMEALVRWPRNGGWMRPAEFVPRAQELGLGGDLDRWVVGRACRQLAEWRDQGGWEDLAMTVNVAPATLAEPGLADDVLGAAGNAGLTPDSLVLEITEEALTVAGPASLAELARLRDAGVRIAIDDFGTGHSSLARLRDLPVDIMKLDRLLVERVDRDAQARDIARAVLQLAATMGLRVVAEGVERPEQREALLSLGCDCGQGFHFAEPDAATAGPTLFGLVAGAPL